MERLTKVDGIGQNDLIRCFDCGPEKAGANLEHCGFCEDGWQRALDRLAAYEDTGLEPEDVTDLLAAHGTAIGQLTEYRALGPIDRLRELVQAEKDGRMVVLSAKNGNTIYVKGEDQVVECYIMETYLDDQKGIEYFVSFECEYLEKDNACKGCPFYSWKQDYGGEWSCDGEYGQSCVIAADIGKTVFLTREEAETALSSGHDQNTQEDQS